MVHLGQQPPAIPPGEQLLVELVRELAAEIDVLLIAERVGNQQPPLERRERAPSESSDDFNPSDAFTGDDFDIPVVWADEDP